MHTTPATAHPETDVVVVVGEALIDIIETAAGPVEFPGGSGMNVAFGVGRLGISTTLITALGSDERGKTIRNHLHSAGVRLHAGVEHLKRTSTARALLDGSGSAEYAFDLEWSLPDISPTFLPKVLHTGSLASFLEPGATQVRSLLELFSGHCLITYDPNIRQALLGSHAEALTTFERTVPFATVVKLSAEDAWWLYPGRQPRDIASRLLKLGAELAIITDGSAGSYLRSNTAETDVPAPQVAVKDTVGAGDSYMASLIAGLLDEPEADFGYGRLARLGTSASLAAAITVGRHGANPPTRAELNASLELVQTSRKCSDD
ncbi:carbohydrate kinase [Arthrobacter sp. ov118]|uniref:carbohydrate kinase family protein n=1 Tax=Arthrobacter sp. ov118 TaxID=1761747 RepID=UPI0008EAB9ED|nr:carbohydrate kinase [Arthrobacter sp. ov118]SFT85265.1 fructokinase [Arthrobacter sp. ov118]